MITAPTHPIKAAIVSLILCIMSIGASAQFDTKFYMPPIWDAQAANLNQPSELFITTPFPGDVNVHVQTADGVTFVFDGVVSAGNPLDIPLTTAVGQTTVQNAVLETGLIITSDKPVQASHRVAAENNQTLITLKGENGKGQDFWCGSQVRNLNQNYFPEEYHFISVMATENNTTITIETPFAMFANGGGDLSNPVVIQLNKDDSYLIRGHDPTEHVAGAHVTSDKDILVTSGSTHTRISGTSPTAADGGTDQLVPVDLMGNSFVVVRGDNDPTYDYAIIVATEDGTEVTIDGVGPPTLLNAGEFFDYTLTGSMGTPHYISTTGVSYCYHVSGASQNQEVGMSCMPQLECTGSRYIENSRLPANAETQVMTFVVPPEAEPTFTINGIPYASVAGVTSQVVPGLTDWIAVTVPDGSMLQNNVYQSEGFFHAGFLTGDNGNTGTFGYLSGFDDAFEFIDPNEDLPTTVYVADSLCQGEQSLHCLQVYSCSDDHNIIDFEGNEGEIIVTPGVPGFAFDTCFQYTAPFDFVGNDTITFTVDNRFGFEGSIDVVFFVVDPSTPIDAGVTQQLCSETTGTLSAVNPDPLVDGYWVLIGSGPQITDPNSPTTTVTDLNVGTNTFIWTQEYGCSTRTDITQINVFVGEPPVADAGEDVHLCNSDNTYVFQGNDPGTSAIGSWLINEGTAQIFNINNPNAPVIGIDVGENIFSWTINNGDCPGGETSSEMSIFVYPEDHPAATVSPDQEFCDIDFTSTSITGSDVIFPASGQWSLIGGSGDIVSPNSATTEILNCDVGVNIFRWTINNGPCGDLTADVAIYIYDDELASPNAGDDASYCTPTTSHALNASAFAAPAFGTWSVFEGEGTFDDVNDPATTVSNLGPGTNILRWTVDNGPCASSGDFDDVTITIFDNTEPVANAGEDQDFCSDVFTQATLQANAPTFPATGMWSVVEGSADFSDETDPNAVVTLLSTGVNELRWTISNGPCDAGDPDEVLITIFDVSETTILAGDDVEYCTPTSTHTMNATAVPAPAMGEWTLEDGTGTISDINDPSAEISGLGVGENVFRWTLINGPCEEGVHFDEVSIFIFDENQEPADAGDDQEFCFNPVIPVQAIMNAEATIAPAVGTWTVFQGGGFIQDPNNPSTAISGIPVGENIFQWTVYNGDCDPETTEAFVSVFVFDNTQPIANAGDDQFLCSDLPETLLDGSSVTFPGSGTWVLESGTANILEPNNPNSPVTGVGLGINTFRWTVDNGLCDPETSTDLMTITVNEGAVTIADAGDDASVCSTTGSVTLDANLAVFPAEGEWTVINGSGIFDDETDNNTNVSGLSVGENVFRWTLNNGACSGFTDDDVSVFVYDDEAPNAAAGEDQEICFPTDVTTMTATSAVFPATGVWTLISGAGDITEPNNPSSEITGLEVGENVFRWTVNNSPCTPATTFEQVSIFVFDGNSDVADAGTDQAFCAPVSSATLSANAPVFPATGQWTLVSGSGTPTNPTSPITQVTGLDVGDNVFEWTIFQAPCAQPSTSSQVTVTIFDNTQAPADAGEDQAFCSPQTSTFLEGNPAPYPASGEWLLVSGAGNILDPNNPFSEVTDLGIGTNVFSWTINNGPCTPSTTSNEVSILVFNSGDVSADAGDDQELCLPTSSTFLEGNTPTAPSEGVWTRTSGSGSILDPSDPGTQITGLAVGENVFRWTVNNGDCGVGATFEEVSIFVYSNTSPVAAAGPDQNLCTPETSTFLEGNTPTFPATGTWTVITGGGTVTNPNDPNSEITGLSIGENRVEWTLDNGPCLSPISSNEVSIFVFDGGAPQPDAGEDQELCTPTTNTFMTADPALDPGVGTWSLFSGTGNIISINDPETEITGLTTGVNTFVWTLDYATCGLQQDTVQIILYDSTVPAANAGADQEFCSPISSSTLDADAVNAPGFGTWSLISGSGIIDNVNDPNSDISNLTIGENVFVWTVYNGGCLAEEFRTDTVSVFIFDENQIAAEAGDDQEICTPQESVFMAGNEVTFPAIGTWTITSGSGEVVSPNDPNSEIINLEVGETELEWTISNGNCAAGASSDQVTVLVFDENQAAANAGDDQNFCTPVSAFNLDGNALTYPASGEWVLLSGQATIQDSSNPNSLITDLGVGENILQWTVSNGPCGPTTSDVVSLFVFNQFNETANAGEDQEICTPEDQVTLEGNLPVFPSTGVWTLISGTGTIDEPSNPNTLVTGLEVGENVFRWTVQNGPCEIEPSTNDVTIFVFDQNAVLADAGDDQEFCSPTDTSTLDANTAPIPGFGTWTLISGAGTPTEPNNPTTEVTGLQIGENIFEWNIYNGPCATSGSTDQVSIFIFDENQDDAFAGEDQQVCTPAFSTTLEANAANFPASGEWTVIQGTGVVTDINNPQSTVENLSLGDNVLVWTILNGPCNNATTTDTVLIQLFDLGAAVADAGEDQEFCLPDNSTNLEGNEVFNATIGTWTLIQGQGSIDDINSHNTLVTDLGVGENIFEWTVDNGLCGLVSDQVSIFVFDPISQTANAGENQEFCTPISTTTLDGNTPDEPGIGTWTLLTGTATIDSPNDPNSEISGLTIGENILCWTIYNGPCAEPSTDCVSIFIFDENAPDANAGDDQEICLPNQQVLLNAETPIFPAIGTWTIVQGSGDVFDVNDPNSLVTNLEIGTNLIEWRVDNSPCDQGATADTLAILVFSEDYNQANAGNDQEFCSPISTTVMTGSVLDDPNSGTWNLIGGNGVISNPDDPETLISGLTVGTNSFTWEVYNGPCIEASSIDTVDVFIFDQNQAPADAGNDQELCLPTNTTFLQGNLVTAPASGSWEIVAGSATIVDPTDPESEITDLELGINTFVWTIDNGPCEDAITSDTVNIIVFEEDALTANAGEDMQLCLPTSSVVLSATPPSIPTTGTWTIVSGSGSIVDVNNPNATLTGLVVGEVVLQWTIYNGPCANNNSFDFVNIEVFDPSDEPANAGEDQEWCAPTPEVILEGSVPVFPAFGTWTIISGVGNLSDLNDPAATLSGLDVGQVELTWTVDNGECNTPTIDTVRVSIFDPMSPNADAGLDQEFCTPFIGTNLAGNEVIFPSYGVWTQISGTSEITDSTEATSSVFDLGFGENIYVYEVYNGACENSISSDTVSFYLNDLSVAAANAGPDMNFCGGLDSLQLMGSETIGNTAFGVWSINEGSGEFFNENNEFTYVYDIPVGLHEYVWTVDNGFCGITADTMQVVIYDPELPQAYAGEDENICGDDFLIFNLQGSNVEFPASASWEILEGPVEISDPLDPNATVYDLGEIFVPLEDIVSELVWTVNNGVCGTSADSVTYVLNDCLTIEIPDAFSPNGDGINDEFVIPNLFKYPDNTFKVFNRWGAEVYSAAPYNNDWDGTAQTSAFGEQLPVSTYYYILDLGNGGQTFTGYIYLKR